MNRRDMARDAEALTVPRRRGDEPSNLLLVSEEATCSPQARG